MREEFFKYPLFAVSAVLIFGIILATLPISVYWAIIVVIAGLILVAYKHYRWGILTIILSLGFVNMKIHNTTESHYDINNSITYYGIVYDVSNNSSGQHIVVSTTDTLNNLFKCRLTIPSILHTYNPGDSILFKAKLSPPQRDISPDAFNYANFLKGKGIIATAFIAPDSINFVNESQSLYWKIRRLQPTIANLLKTSNLSNESIEFLTATLTGDDSIIPEETRMTFTTSGLAHILALSGLHVGIITTMLWILLFPLRLVRQLHLRLISTVVILWLYAIITGLSPSVVRAVIMATTLLIGFCLQRRNSSINSLCLASIIILIASPLQLYDIGFQLSFIAVASILLFSHRLNPINPKHKIAHFVISMIIVSSVATLGTGIVATYYFHTFPTYFLIANVIVLAILPLTMISGMILIVILAICSGISTEWLCTFIDWTYSLILDYSKWVNAMPYSSIKGIYFSPWILLPYFITLATLLWAIIKRKIIHWLIFIIGVALTATAFLLTRKTYTDSEFFIARESRHTNIICRYDKQAFLITTAQPQLAQTALANANRRHKDFLAMRGVDSLNLVSDSFTYNSLNCQRQMISIGKKRLILVTDEKDLDSIPINSPNYIIVCRGYKGNVIDMLRHNPDTIVLSGDLHIRRHDRYLDSLVKYSIPHISLRNDGIIHILNP